MGNVKLGIKVTAKGKYLTAESQLEGKIKPTQKFKSKFDKAVLLKQTKNIAEGIKDIIRNNIVKARRYDGRAKLTRLSKSTIKRKGSARILIETAQLLNGIEVVKRSSSYIVKMSDKYYRVRKAKNKGKYGRKRIRISEVAQFLQSGTKRMPSRPFFGVQKKQMDGLINKFIIKDK